MYSLKIKKKKNYIDKITIFRRPNKSNKWKNSITRTKNYIYLYEFLVIE